MYFLNVCMYVCMYVCMRPDSVVPKKMFSSDSCDGVTFVHIRFANSVSTTQCMYVCMYVNEVYVCMYVCMYVMYISTL